MERYTSLVKILKKLCDEAESYADYGWDIADESKKLRSIIKSARKLLVNIKNESSKE